MGKKLVIVESPAKAKTIRRFLGPDYEVEASVGHIRDLPQNRKGVPEQHRKKWWADFAVDVDDGFKPFYEVPSEKRKYVERLKTALKGADELVLATDEDREGESISWHLLQVLKPPKSVTIRRIAFHEITREAILEALSNPRPIDEQLVEAQETRRVLDRLYGYTLSPVLWSKIAKDLSAGRVQSPAVKLIVDREKRRKDFRVSVYWDLKVDLSAEGGEFTAVLRAVDGQRIATGKDFDELTGALTSDRVQLLDASLAAEIARDAKTAEPWSVRSIETNPGVENQPPPFRTTTLQQEANRKLGLSADRTMRIAQDLYEGVDLKGERVGLITYMRTDSLSLSEAAVAQAREVIRSKYGAEHLPPKANRYASKVANAQEAHEAIRPTDFSRTPDSVRAALEGLSDMHFKVYDLIYRRTLACQMRPAQVLRTSVEVGVQAGRRDLVFGASGKTIEFPGFLLAYVEDSDDPEAELEGKERVLPPMKKGDVVKLVSLDALEHATKPPARYTDASLIKALEDLGIGRPSTYAQIISVIVDRGYVRKKGRELIPTFVAFMVVDLLEQNFGEFVDLGFTANMDDSLDDIANGKLEGTKYLRAFFLGDGKGVGLKEAVESRKREIPFPALDLGVDEASGNRVLVRIGRGGNAFVQLGEAKKYANVPEDIAPADLTVQKALELLNSQQEGSELAGIHPQTGRNLLIKQRGGFYLEVERTPEEIEAKVKPTWISLPPGIHPKDLNQEDLNLLCSLPLVVGNHPESGEEIVFRIGKYGPYIQCGKEIRNFEDWRSAPTLSVERAVEILSMDKRAAARSARAATGPLKEFGALDGAAGPVRVMPGRFGPYVTDGSVNATIPKNISPESITPEQALELIRAKAAQGPSKKKRGFRKRAKK